MRVLRDRGLAEDAVQNAYLDAWLKCGRFDPDRGSVEGWLMVIVFRRAQDLRPRSAVLEYDSGGGAHDGAENPVEGEVLRREERLRLRRDIRRLPVEQARAIELVYLVGMSRPWAAQLLDIPPSTLKARLRLGIEQMRSRPEFSRPAAGAGG